MKTFKKALAVVMCVVMVLTAAPLGGLVGMELPSLFNFKVEAATYSGSCGSNVKWSLNTSTGVLTISGTGAIAGVGPDDNYNWRYSAWKEYIRYIDTIVIEDGITSIGRYAFYQHTALKNVYIAESVTTINECAFASCSNLKNVTIPEGVTSIGEYAFLGCKCLNEIIIPESVMSIGEHAFDACDSLVSITLPSKVSVLPEYMFYGCEKLETVVLPDRLTKIENYVFKECPSLCNLYYAGTQEEWAKVSKGMYYDYSNNFDINMIFEGESENPYRLKGTCGDDLTFVVNVDWILEIDGTGDMDSYGLTVTSQTVVNTPWWSKRNKIKGIKIGENVTKLGTLAFAYCNSLDNVVIPDNIRVIEYRAFEKCYNLKSITLPKTINNIAYEAFLDCQNLKDIYYDGCIKDWEKIIVGSGNTYFNNATPHYAYHYINWVVDGNITEERVKVGNSISTPTDLEKDFYTFSGWDNEIPDVMPESDLTFTAQFTPITYYAEFVVDGNLIGTVPYTVESESIEEPEIPAVDGYTGTWEEYEFTPGGITVNAVYTANPHTVIWVIDGEEKIVDDYGYGDEIVKPADPEKEGHTFTGWDKEIASTVPDEDLVYTATWKKNSYTVKWNIDGVITEEPYDYGDEITAPVPEKDGMFFVGWGAVIPETMPAENLEFIAQWNKTNFEYEKDKNGNVTIIGAKDASGDIEIPDNINGYPVTAIAEAAFAGSDITSVTIPEGVETIGECAFAYCENLKTVNIPASVTALGETAFVGSTNIEKINISADNECYATDEYGVIYNKDFTLLIYAPAKSVGEAYTMCSTAVTACELSFADCTDFALTLSDGFSVDSSSMFFDILSVTGFITGKNCVNYKAIDGVLYNKAVTTLIKYPVDSKRDLLIPPASVEYIADEYAFVTPEIEKSIIVLFGLDYDSNTFANMYREPEYLTVHIDSFYDFDSDSLVFLMMGPSHVCFGDTTKAENDQLNEIADNAIANIESQWEEKKDELTPGSIEYYYNEAFVLGYVDLITSYIDCQNDHTRLHKYAQVVETKDPTCTVDGYVNYDCDCGYEFTDIITAPGHDYESVITEPTCTEKGFTTHTCSVCGDTYTDSEVKENGHSYESVVTKVTCTTDGYTTHTCSVCDDTYTDSVVKAEGHKYDSVVTPNTCTKDGYTTHTCSVCDDTYTDSETKATGHSHESKVTKEPTCTNTGIRTFTCHCGDSYTEVIKAKGHTKGEWEYIGGKEYAKSCTVCGDKLESKIVTVDMFFNSENVNKKQVLNKSTATVTATVTDNFVNDLVFASSDNSTVSVDANGNVVANNIGKATITVTIKGTAISDNIEVEVLPRDFTVTWNVNGKQTKQTVKEEEKLTPNVNTTLKGYKFIGWDKTVPTTMPAENLTFTAQYELIVKQLKIKNPSTSTINYGETLVMHADFGGVELPEGWKIQWTVEGAGFDMAPAADGLTCKMTSFANGNATVKATLVDENGEAVLDADGNEMSDSKQLTSKAGFWQKFVSFFKNLFGISRVILQSI